MWFELSQQLKTKLEVSHFIIWSFVKTIPRDEKTKYNKTFLIRILRGHFVIAVSFRTDDFMVDTGKFTEDDTNRQGQSSPFSERERCVLDPFVNPQTPSSWPLRPDSTGLRQICVAGHVVPFSFKKLNHSIKHHVMPPVVMSPWVSWIDLVAVEHGEANSFFEFTEFKSCGSFSIVWKVEMSSQSGKGINILKRSINLLKISILWKIHTVRPISIFLPKPLGKMWLVSKQCPFVAK